MFTVHGKLFRDNVYSSPQTTLWKWILFLENDPVTMSCYGSRQMIPRQCKWFWAMFNVQGKWPRDHVYISRQSQEVVSLQCLQFTARYLATMFTVYGRWSRENIIKRFSSRIRFEGSSMRIFQSVIHCAVPLQLELWRTLLYLVRQESTAKTDMLTFWGFNL